MSHPASGHGANSIHMITGSLRAPTHAEDVMQMKTILEILEDCDNFPYFDTPAGRQEANTLWTFHLPDDERPHGYLLDSVVARIPWFSDFKLISAPACEVHVLKHGTNWQTACSESIDKLLDIIRGDNIFPDLGKKRNEKFEIVGAQFPTGIERSASSLFGIIGKGVHMTVFARAQQGMKIWIAKRSASKSTFPGALDNAVAGGVALGEMPFECLIREAMEEAQMGEEEVRQGARAAGTVTWVNVSDERAGGEIGLINPGLLFVYDLEVGEDRAFGAVEDDIESFQLMSTSEVMSALREARFKPASACVMVDFLVRHGVLTAENESDFAEIVSRLHRRLPFPTSAKCR